jgi:AcrR family transcriptional regulator
MKNTKGRILDTALHLFNKRGLSKVTLRTIAKEMGISQGNLNYHFKKRDDIIEVLYFELVKEMDEIMARIPHSTTGLQLLYDISSAILSSAYNYRFFFFDFTQIMRENVTIRAHFQKLVYVRQEQTLRLFDMMVNEGIMRAESLPSEYFHLYKRTQIFGDFWMSSVKVEKVQIDQSIIDEYLKMIMQSFYPYLTDKGIKLYQSLMA